jgi:hypothetical protein
MRHAPHLQIEAWHHPVVSARDGTRLLIATGEAAATLDEVPPLVRSLIQTASEIVVITPILVSGLQWLASDTDRARYEADDRLSTVLGHVESMAPEAEIRAEVGDDTPMTALDDVMRRFQPDHMLIALRASDHDAWQERGLLDEIRGAFHVPMTVFAVDRAGRVPSAPG